MVAVIVIHTFLDQANSKRQPEFDLHSLISLINHYSTQDFIQQPPLLQPLLKTLPCRLNRFKACLSVHSERNYKFKEKSNLHSSPGVTTKTGCSTTYLHTTKNSNPVQSHSNFPGKKLIFLRRNSVTVREIRIKFICYLRLIIIPDQCSFMLYLSTVFATFTKNVLPQL